MQPSGQVQVGRLPAGRGRTDSGAATLRQGAGSGQVPQSPLSRAVAWESVSVEDVGCENHPSGRFAQAAIPQMCVCILHQALGLEF